MNATDPPLLLLDLDGVLVTQRAPAPGESREILLLHRDLAQRLAMLPMRIAVLTDRPRREARCILRSAGIGFDRIAGLFAAEDLFVARLRLSSMRPSAIRRPRRHLILPLLHKRFGVAPHDVIFIDDRVDDIKALARDGLGLGIHAPSSEAHGDDAPPGLLVTFDFAEALRAISDWIPATRSWVTLTPITFEMAEWRRTGIDTVEPTAHLLQRARRVGSALRQWVA